LSKYPRMTIGKTAVLARATSLGMQLKANQVPPEFVDGWLSAFAQIGDVGDLAERAATEIGKILGRDFRIQNGVPFFIVPPRDGLLVENVKPPKSNGHARAEVVKAPHVAPSVDPVDEIPVEIEEDPDDGEDIDVDDFDEEDLDDEDDEDEEN
jgi:hypothetical protein